MLVKTMLLLLLLLLMMMWILAGVLRHHNASILYNAIPLTTIDRQYVIDILRRHCAIP